MHTEVHLHGTVALRSGVTQAEVEQALRPLFEYVDVDGLADARSAIQDEPGIVFDRRRRALEICWTGYVGRNFYNSLETAFQLLSPYSEEATAVEVSYYHEDGQDEHGWVFVGPTREAVQEMQRRRLIDDVSAVLTRHFGEAEINEVASLLDQLFVRRGADPAAGELEPERKLTMSPAGKKHLH
jgi:hypothetical protein